MTAARASYSRMYLQQRSYQLSLPLSTVPAPQEKEFAIDVTLSDESNYVIFRTVKEITNLHVSVNWMYMYM